MPRINSVVCVLHNVLSFTLEEKKAPPEISPTLSDNILTTDLYPPKASKDQGCWIIGPWFRPWKRKEQSLTIWEKEACYSFWIFVFILRYPPSILLFHMEHCRLSHSAVETWMITFKEGPLLQMLARIYFHENTHPTRHMFMMSFLYNWQLNGKGKNLKLHVFIGYLTKTFHL